MTEAGRRQATALREPLSARSFAAVLTSPLSRASETCRIAGYGDRAVVRDELHEWDYGEYEGLTTPEIRRDRPEWSLWRDGCPGGETADRVGARADRVISELREVDGVVALFAHGHILRVLASRWVGLAPEAGALLLLDTATVSEVGWDREIAVIRRWNLSP